jgi:hypothetical protein
MTAASGATTIKRLILASIFVLAALMFLPGINWGLPSRDVDQFLFGPSRPAWSGERIMQLAGAWDDSAGRGADIAMHPLTRREEPIVVNQTDADRAQIIRRFRLYSCQPDEMITFRALSRMKPSRGDLDPQFFQYGGLWVYPIGALLKLASLLHLVTLRTDLAFYLDHPEEFGRFYIVARLYSAMWGLAGVGVVYAIAGRCSRRFLVGITAAALYATMPVVVNMAHEAKPHLPGTVLTLAAVWMAMRYVGSGTRRDWILTGALCGAAFGMVLTGIVAFAVLPVMTTLRPLMRWRQRLIITLAAAGVGGIVFVVTNPYLPYDYLFRRGVVQSNVGNYGNFYRPAISTTAMINGVRLIGEGMSPVLAVAGAIGLLVLLVRRRNGVGWLVVAPSLLVALQYLLLARDKPAEYARFALTLDVGLILSAAGTVGFLKRPDIAGMAVGALVGCTAFFGVRYTFDFVRAAGPRASREAAADALAVMQRPGRTLLVWAEPAPYCLPAVDLFDWRIVLLPRGADAPDDQQHGWVSVRPVDVPWQQPISWANKSFDLRQSE